MIFIIHFLTAFFDFETDRINYHIIILIGLGLAGIAKYARSRELSGKLGRKVEDHELVSLNSWMEVER